jgi:hypothetical protein
MEIIASPVFVPIIRKRKTFLFINTYAPEGDVIARRSYS